LNFEVKQGDCLEVLKTLPEESIDCCITSPPYWGLRDYGMEAQIGLEKSPYQYVSNIVSVFRGVRKALKNCGTIWVNIGDSYSSKPIERENTTTTSSIPPKSLIGIPWMVAFALQADGWVLRQDIIWHKPNPMPEGVTDRCTKAHEYIFLMSKSTKYYFCNESIQEKCTTCEGRPSGIVRDRVYGYDSKQSKLGKSRGGKETPEPTTRNKRSVWSVNVDTYKDAHFAVFPKQLIEPCVLAGCPKDGVVLDPFGGSGTTAEVAIENGRNAILIELNPDYIELAKTRVRNCQPKLL
jgi:DNA modification methylase